MAQVHRTYALIPTRGPEQEPDSVHEGELLRRRNAAIAQMSRGQGQTPRIDETQQSRQRLGVPQTRPALSSPVRDSKAASLPVTLQSVRRVDWQREAGAPSCVPPARTGSGFALSPRRFVNATGVPLLAQSRSRRRSATSASCGPSRSEAEERRLSKLKVAV